MSSYRLISLSLLGLSSLLFACGSDSNGAGPCDTSSPLDGCGAACSDANPCGAGLYCGDDGTCTADCTASGDQCDDGEECSAGGQCVPGGSDDDSGDNAGDDNDSGDDSGDDDCPSVQVDLAPVVPVVTLLIDQSGSMNDGFPNDGDPSRWDSMKAALIGTNDDGVLFQLQGSLIMGATLYTSDDGTTNGGQCPLLEEVPPKVNNAAAIAALLEGNDPVEDTPTAESVAAVAATFENDGKPHVIVLATDGLPDTCEVPDPETELGQIASENAVKAAYDDLGITTFVLAVGPASSDPHFQRVANVGQGKDIDLPSSSPDAAKFYPALNAGQLVDAFQEIGTVIRSCDITVDGTVDLDRADEGTVILNGTELEYGTAWEMADDHTIRLTGACDTFLSAETVELSAEFPCGGVIVD